jgi:hypothetical protein
MIVEFGATGPNLLERERLCEKHANPYVRNSEMKSSCIFTILYFVNQVMIYKNTLFNG